jgi:hypothetical protein
MERQDQFQRNSTVNQVQQLVLGFHGLLGQRMALGVDRKKRRDDDRFETGAHQLEAPVTWCDEGSYLFRLLNEVEGDLDCPGHWQRADLIYS